MQLYKHTEIEFVFTNSVFAGVCKDFERKLRNLNPHMPTITYEIGDLYGYIDDMVDISALVYDPKMNAYIPCNKEWIKSTAYEHLKQEGSRR